MLWTCGCAAAPSSRKRQPRAASRPRLGENHDAVRTDAHIGVEVQPVFGPWTSHGVETVAMLEAGVIDLRAAVEAHRPSTLTREADVQGRLCRVREIDDHDDVIARAAIFPPVVRQSLITVVKVKD